MEQLIIKFFSQANNSKCRFITKKVYFSRYKKIYWFLQKKFDFNTFLRIYGLTESKKKPFEKNHRPMYMLEGKILQ